MKMHYRADLNGHVDLRIYITPEPTDDDLARIADGLDFHAVESVFAARLADHAVMQTVRINKFTVVYDAYFKFSDRGDAWQFEEYEDEEEA
jgi:hypothetical protein